MNEKVKVNWVEIVNDDPGVLEDFASSVISLRCAINEMRKPEARRELYKLEKLGDVTYARNLARRALRRRGFNVSAPTLR